MGVSLETYRMSIGIFIPKSRKRRQSSRLNRKFVKNISIPMIKLSLFVSICLALLFDSGGGSMEKFVHTSRSMELFENYSEYEDDLLQSTDYYVCIGQKFKMYKMSDSMVYCFETSSLRVLFDDVNFYARYINGNRSNRGIKITHWNLGSSYLVNKIQEIETLVADFRPHLLGISESNLFSSQNQDDVMIEDYELFTALTIENRDLQVSRVVVYKHKSLVAKLRKDLMSEDFSSIWLEVGLPKQKKILVCNLYREHQYLKQDDSTSSSHNEQLSRWMMFLDQ